MKTGWSETLWNEGVRRHAAVEAVENARKQGSDDMDV